MWGWRSTRGDGIDPPRDADTTVPPQQARLYAKAIPGAQLRLHPGQGHFSIFGAVREILAPLTG